MVRPLTIPELRKRPHAILSMSHASPAERLAYRAEMCIRIGKLLKRGPLTAPEIANIIGVLPTTAQSYLRYMASNLRTVRKTQVVAKYGRCKWELGEDPTLPTPDEMLDQAIAPRQKLSPARQLGMPRDPLIAALFGPAA